MMSVLSQGIPGTTASKFAKFSWALLFYTLLVVLWGALVRATFSGDGCGNNWPQCGDHGIIPSFEQAKTLIEFIHRASVPILTLLLVVQFIWCFSTVPKGSAVRKSVGVSAFFIVLEALIGP